MSKKHELVIIKKYANRRLYDTSTSTYVVLDDLSEMVKRGEEFKVEDAKTAEDLTRQVLVQIIFEQESKGMPMFQPNFLRNLIRYYDDNLNTTLPGYLEGMMEMFHQNRAKMNDLMKATQQPFSAIPGFEEISRRNMEFFEKTFDTMMQMNPMMFLPKHLQQQAGKKDEKK
jgi:polyhydroxyalkanoate synthesis repressor PhaR